MLIFAFQAENIAGRAFHVVLITIPILVQVYFNASLVYGLMRPLRMLYAASSSWPLRQRSRSRVPARGAALATGGLECSSRCPSCCQCAACVRPRGTGFEGV